MTTTPFPALKTFYLAGQPVHLPQVAAGTEVVVARSAFGHAQPAQVRGGEVTLAGLAPGTYAIEAWSADRRLLGDDITTVAATAGERPVPGFVTSFRADTVPDVLAWLRALRCTSVQFYDWMHTYAVPLASTENYADRLGRRHSLTAITQLTEGCRDFGATPQAYAPVYAADPVFGEAHPDWLLSRSDGEPQRLGDLLDITDPGNPSWQRHWLDAYGAAADALDFGGFHLDTYGYPREPLDHAGRPVPIDAAYARFLRAVRAARPQAVLSFNQVNGVPRGFELAGPPGYRYVEVWPPNDRWRHLEGLLQRSVPAGSAASGVFAIYPPVWAADRAAALRTVVLTEAVTVTLGSSMLVFGDDRGCLQHPFYPDYQRLTADECRQVLRWHTFGLRCRDLFAGGTDTSWYDIGDENGAVAVRWAGAVAANPVPSDSVLPESVLPESGLSELGPPELVLPEPAGGAVYARVVRHDGCIAVSVLDLSGSTDGSWQSPTGPGRCRSVTVSVLLDEPGRWRAEAAVLGQDDGRFAPVATVLGVHREGRSIEIQLPVVAGWSVLRVTRAT